ncbi:hypothetical protein VOLCADRAFT_92108 [Volvox carteri f. nagariensis]|uniref:RING-type domain-containing protein n=1 Tax=Volvox carteri f. nagariensis TaxID=3068 RepID=D8TYM0_VOLCA|nr:uncharacterized protein VOLCADRAFT_92108 [Volvox carteri f. nagariensis]EFJ47333.1 hypothetical protein VOLCADRAFT_92108 [Volvox carteri f. nagariensis]|eukprot:XP_002951522.1 hypothetical protein VOLCADRAFT_92108 [Volvox carteri f. nagariensis]
MLQNCIDSDMKQAGQGDNGRVLPRRRSGGLVEAAVNLYMENPNSGRASVDAGGSAGAAAGSANAAAGARGSGSGHKRAAGREGRTTAQHGPEVIVLAESDGEGQEPQRGCRRITLGGGAHSTGHNGNPMIGIRAPVVGASAAAGGSAEVARAAGGSGAAPGARNSSVGPTTSAGNGAGHAVAGGSQPAQGNPVGNGGAALNPRSSQIRLMPVPSKPKISAGGSNASDNQGTPNGLPPLPPTATAAPSQQHQQQEGPQRVSRVPAQAAGATLTGTVSIGAGGSNAAGAAAAGAGPSGAAAGAPAGGSAAAGAAGTATAAGGAAMGRVEASRQATRPDPNQPLLLGNLIADVKRTQGPYPVAPLLPLPEHRRPDGSLFLADQDAVPDRSPPVQQLNSLKWPMLLGKVVTPLELGMCKTVEGRESVLNMALDWLKEGKLVYGSTSLGQRCDEHADLFWKLEFPHPIMVSPGPWLERPQEQPDGWRLALFVDNRDFWSAAMAKFPGLSPNREIRLATTVVGCNVQRLVNFYLLRKYPLELNRAQSSSVIPVNIRILGPGLDPEKGVMLRVDVPESDLGRELEGTAARPGIATTKAAAQEGFGSAHDADSDGSSGDGDAREGPSDSDQESDVEDGAAAAGSKRKRPLRGSGGGNGADGAGMARGASRKKGSRGSTRGAEPKRPSRAAKERGAGRAAAAGEVEGSMDSQRPRKRVRRLAETSGAGCLGGALPAPAMIVGAGSSMGMAGGSATGGQQPNRSGEAPAAMADGTFRLSLEFYITEETLKATTPPTNWSPVDIQHGKCTGRGNKYNRDGAEHLANIIHVLLEHGTGLYVGPDCDGVINTMDVLQQAAQRASKAGGAGSDRCSLNRGGSVDGSTAGAAGAPGSGANAAKHVINDEGSNGPADELRDLDALLDSIQPPNDLPQAAVPPPVVARPKPFQLQGLEWMMRREQRGDALGRSLLLLHPAWAQVVLGSTGLVLQVHRLSPWFITADFFPAPVGGTCGGFLCDEMGLGKSVQTLMLIVSNPSPPGWAAKPVPLASGNGSGAGSSRCNAVVPMTALADTGDNEPIPIPTTLLVTPLNLQRQWVEEIERHLRPGSLKWAIYHGRGDSHRPHSLESDPPLGTSAESGEDGKRAGARPSRRTRQLAAATDPGKTLSGRLLPPAMAYDGNGNKVPVHGCDVVLVSYEVLRKELTAVGDKTSQSLPRLGFWRIVLDEAQLVANSNCVAAEVASSLYRRHAWVVTGTPISSCFNEVKGLCQFLSYEPFYHSVLWRKLIEEPLTQRGLVGLTAIRALLRGVMLRRSKAAVADQLALPPCVREDLTVELSGVERAFYDVLKARFNTSLAAMRSAGSAANTAYQRASTQLVELRQSCCHPQIVRREAQAGGGLRGSGGDGAGAAGSKGQGSRRSMRQIMSKMVTDAYTAYDQAVAYLYGSRLQQAALDDCRRAGVVTDAGSAAGTHTCAPADGGGERTAGSSVGAMGTGAAGGRRIRSGSAHAAVGAAGPTSSPSLSSLEDLLESIRKMTKLVSEPDILHQAKIRERDGAVKWERAHETAAFGGVPGGLAAVALPLATEQARERKRRWMRLELDGLMLTCYVACLLAPRGTLQLLAARANARFLAEAQRAAEAKAESMTDTVSYRQALLMEAQTSYEAAKTEAKEAASTGAGEMEEQAARGLGSGASAAAAGADFLLYDSDDEEDGSHGGDSDSDEGDRRRRQSGKRRYSGGFRDRNKSAQKKRRIAAVDGGGGGDIRTVDLLLARGGTRYQEAMFRSEAAVRAFQSVTLKRWLAAEGSGKTPGPAADDPRHLQVVGEKWHDLQHMINELSPSREGQAEQGMAGDCGKSDAAAVATEGGIAGDAVANAAAGPSGGYAGECRTITKCGHTFCTDCIHDIVQDTGAAPCPICRRQLTRDDLFDSVPEEEAEEDDATDPGLGNGEFGAKVSALLEELDRMATSDPCSKALVFSSWGRLLRLVQEALLANNVRCASMVGGNPAARQAALQSFLHDPTCRVLLLLKSHSGGAAGLSLTVAHTAFMLEPAVNPGLEAQAAARICRLGQDRPTRVIRIIAKHTVEDRVLAMQQYKQQLGFDLAGRGSAAGGEAVTESVDGGMLLRFFDKL